MLKIVGTNTSAIGNLTIDEYVPVSFDVESSVLFEPFDWCYGDRQSDLFELIIDRADGKIYRSTLVFTECELIPVNYDICANASVSNGLPLVDVSGVAKNTKIVNNLSPFRVLQSNDRFTVLFGDKMRPSQCMQVGRVNFLVEEDMLIGISFGPLTKQELETIAIWDKYR